MTLKVITRFMQSDNVRNSLTEHIQSVMQICHIWNGANSTTFHDLDIKFPELFRTYIDFQNFPGPWEGGKLQNFQELSRRRGNCVCCVPMVRWYNDVPYHLILNWSLYTITLAENQVWSFRIRTFIFWIQTYRSQTL